MQRNHHSYIRNCDEVVKRLTLQKFQACYCRIRTLTFVIPVQRSNHLKWQANWQLVIQLVRNILSNLH